MERTAAEQRRAFVGTLKRSTVKQDGPSGFWRYYCAQCRWVSGGGDNTGDASEMGARNTGADHRYRVGCTVEVGHRAVWHKGGR